MITNFQYSIENILYFLLEITAGLEIKEAVKFSGYEPENINGNTKTCSEYPPNCIRSCLLNDLCTGIATHHETGRCDSFHLVFYGRVILISNKNSTTWVKGLRLYTFFLVHDRIAKRSIHFLLAVLCE